MTTKTNLLMGAGALAFAIGTIGVARADQVPCLIDNALGGNVSTAFHCQGGGITWYGVLNSGTNQGYITTIKIRYEEFAVHQASPFTTPAPIVTFLDVNPTAASVSPCLENTAFSPAPADGVCTGIGGIK